MKEIVFFILVTLFPFLQLGAFQCGLPSLRKYLPENPVILDCGASNGGSSVELSNMFPDAIVLAVEADPLNYADLTEKVKFYPWIMPFNFILSDRDGTMGFYLNDRKGRDRDQGSIFPQSKENWYWDHIKLEDQATILPCRKLDTFCREIGISKIDFMFLDMQGGEYVMLKASKKIFPKVSVICTEVLFEEIYVNCPLYKDIKRLMERNGFTEIELRPADRSWGDAIFVKNELLKK